MAKQQPTRSAAPRKASPNPPPAATGRSAASRLKVPGPLPVAGDRPRKVRAITMGYYDHVRRREGDVFVLHHPSTEFSKKWMQYVDAGTPEKVTTGREDLRRKHDEILGAHVREGLDAHDEAEHATGDLKVLGE